MYSQQRCTWVLNATRARSCNRWHLIIHTGWIEFEAGYNNSWKYLNPNNLSRSSFLTFQLPCCRWRLQLQHSSLNVTSLELHLVILLYMDQTQGSYLVFLFLHSFVVYWVVFLCIYVPALFLYILQVHACLYEITVCRNFSHSIRFFFIGGNGGDLKPRNLMAKMITIFNSSPAVQH